MGQSGVEHKVRKQQGRRKTWDVKGKCKHRAMSLVQSKWDAYAISLSLPLYAHHKCIDYSGHELVSQYG